jgi:hypothetical protein
MHMTTDVKNDDSDIRLHDGPRPTGAARIAEALAAPFPESELRWKPRTVSGSRALAIPYLTATAVEARLDAVLGADGWEDCYQVLPTGAVICTLRCRIGAAWITRQDVGMPSQQDAIKGCFSDSLKRCARKFGIGRYLCGLGPVWADYDPQRKQITGKPSLPPWALPAKTSPQSETKAEKPAGNGQPVDKPNRMPVDGTELERRLADFEVLLVKEGLCMAGDLLSHVHRAVSGAGKKPGYGPDPSKWPAPAIALAVAAAKAFEQEARAKEKQRREREERLLAPTSGGRRS